MPAAVREQGRTSASTRKEWGQASGRQGRGPATRHRRVADQGEQDRRLSRRWVHRRVKPWARARPAHRRVRGAGQVQGCEWARTGVDVDNGFEALYVVNPDKRATLRSLKEALSRADELLLATDGDREGEAIAWHLLQELKPRTPRVDGLPRDTDNGRGGRRQSARPGLRPGRRAGTRRILDRLYGYEVSPVLWKKVMPRLSAGRVQSIATRLVVDRERERMAFRSASLLGPGRRARRGRRGGAAPVPGPAHPGRGATGGPGSRSSTAPARWSAGVPRRCCGWTKQTPRASRTRCGALSSRSPPSSPSHTRAARTRRSAPRRCSRRPDASSASPRSARCRWPRTCTRPASSPTCGPTRSPCRIPRSPPRATRCDSCSGLTTCPTGRGSTPQRSRTPRRRTRRFDRRGRAFRPRLRLG